MPGGRREGGTEHPGVQLHLSPTPELGSHTQGPPHRVEGTDGALGASKYEEVSEVP